MLQDTINHWLIDSLGHDDKGFIVHVLVLDHYGVWLFL